MPEITEKSIGPLRPEDNLPLKILDESLIHLKELVIERISRIDEKHELKRKYETKIRDLEFQTRDLAKKIFKKNVEFRLINLNNENKRLDAILSQSIPREVHDRDMASIREVLEAMKKVSEINTQWIVRNEGAVASKKDSKDTSTEWIKWAGGIVLGFVFALLVWYITK